LPLRVLAPYAALSLIPGLSVIAFDDARDASGFYFFAIVNCAIYAALLTVVVMRHSIENDVRWRLAPRRALLQHAVCAGLILIPVTGLVVRGPDTLEAIAWGTDSLNLTTTVYSASGAGKGRELIREVHFNLFAVR
jgi:cellulose synthase (UDP-forming)